MDKDNEKSYPFAYFTTVNRNSNPLAVKDEELYDLVNYYSPEPGVKMVRPGLTPFLNQVDNSPVTGLTYVKFPNNSRKLLRFSGDKVYAVDPQVAANWGTNIFINPTRSFYRPEAVILAGKLHIVDQGTNGVGQYFTYDSTTFSETNHVATTNDLVIPYKGRSITVFHRRVYVVSPYYAPNTYKSHLSWSSIDYQNKGVDPQANAWVTDDGDVSSANYRPIDQDYKGGAFKVTNINDRINIYKEEGVYRYNEQQVLSLFGVSAYIGSVATMEETREDYFLTNEGFFKTNGQEQKAIAIGWNPIIKQILANGIDTAKVVSWAVNFQYFCYVGNVTYDGTQKLNACFVYDSKLDEMWLWPFAFEMTAISHYVNVNGVKVVLFGDKNGNVYYLDEKADTDNGKPIQAYFIHKDHFFDDPRLSKDIAHCEAYGTPGVEQELLFSPDFSDQYETKLQINGYFNSEKFDYSKLSQFKFLRAKIQWNGNGKRPRFNGYILSIKKYSDREQR